MSLKQYLKNRFRKWWEWFECKKTKCAYCNETNQYFRIFLYFILSFLRFYDFMQLSGKIEDGRQFESKSVIFQVDVPHLSWGMIPSFQLHCCACSRRLLHVHGGVLQSDWSVELHEWASCRGRECGSTCALSGSGCSSIVSLFFLELKTCHNMIRNSPF